MIDTMFVIRNHLHRDMPEISSIFDISNYSHQFLTSQHIKQIDGGESPKLYVGRNNKAVDEVLVVNKVYKTASSPSSKAASIPQMHAEIIDRNPRPERIDRNPRITKHPDQLFWTVYELHYGREDFQMIRINYGNRYLEERLNVCQKLMDTNMLKSMNHRITKGQIEGIYGELMTPSRSTSLLTLHALCCHYKIRVIILNKARRRYTMFHHETGYTKTHMIEELTNRVGKDPGYRSLKENVSDDEIESLLSEYIKMHHYEKPLAPISKYKIAELREIANNLGIDSTETKPVLYEKICQFMA